MIKGLLLRNTRKSLDINCIPRSRKALQNVEMKFRAKVRLVILGITVVLLLIIYTALFQLPNGCEVKLLELQAELTAIKNSHLIQARLLEGENPDWGPHKLCLLVPFRDRFDELEEFVPHMHQYLNRKEIRHKIMVLNQHDMLRFNRASLINVGFIITEREKECDYIAMHDVDLLPMNHELNYSYPEMGPFHVASPKLHPKYHYSKFVGGILLLTKEQFKKARGLSNRFWGWGREDDEFYLRMVSADLQIYRPENIKTDQYNTFKHLHDREKRQRDYGVYGEQKKVSRRRDYMTGVDTVQYELLSQKEVTISKYKCFVYNIQLYCDLNETPWCVHPNQLKRLTKDAAKANSEAQKKVAEAQSKMKDINKDMQEAQVGLDEALDRMKVIQKRKDEDEPRV